MDDEHVLALVETIHRAYLNAVHVFALDAIFSDDVGHERSFEGLFERLVKSGAPPL
jgi:hypothetical protein